jgi:adenylate cyclase
MSVVFRVFGIRRSSRNPNLCNRCGTHVEEGRIVEMTVVFIDLSSSTELTQELGAEKTHEVVDAFLRTVTNVLVRHGAFIDKYIGDAVMALFNVPIRHADHPRRAVAAASELGAELETLRGKFKLPLEVSVGIATGWARVGRLGSEDSKDYTAIGDVVNLAARLQSKARAGEILISRETFTSPSLSELSGAGAERLVLKGFREPVNAYRLQGKQDALPSAAESPETSVKAKVSLGAVVFGILGAPCAVTTLISPLAVALGAGSLFGLSAALTFFDRGAIRLPILALAALAALANLYTALHARRLRLEDKVPAHLKTMTTLEKRRTLLVVTASVLTLGIIAFELVAHSMLHA